MKTGICVRSFFAAALSWTAPRIWPLALALCLPATANANQLFIDPQFAVEVTSAIPYGANVDGNGNSVTLLLDLYRPVGAGVPEQLPAIVLMHGGYYAAGSRSNMAELAQGFAARGYVAASIDYRLLSALAPPPGAPLTLPRLPGWLPDQLTAWNVTLAQYMNTIAAATQDQAMALNWLVANAPNYNINPNSLAAGGYSAGAVSSLLLAANVVDGVERPELDAVFSIAGALFGREADLGADSPGIFLMHGELDDVVPFSETAYLESALIHAGVPFDTLYVPGADHTSPLLLAALAANEARMYQFLLDQFDPRPVPEPSSALLAGIAGLGLLLVNRRRRIGELSRRFVKYDVLIWRRPRTELDNSFQSLDA